MTHVGAMYSAPDAGAAHQTELVSTRQKGCQDCGPCPPPFGFSSRRRRIWHIVTIKIFQRARVQTSLPQNGKGHKTCTRVKDDDPPTHLNTQACDPHTATLCSSQEKQEKVEEKKNRKNRKNEKMNKSQNAKMKI